MKTIAIVEGMTCQHCVKSVKSALEELAGVTSADVNLEAKTATIESSEAISNEVITDCIDSIGFDLVEIKSA